MANYGLTFTVDSPYLLEEGVDVDDFPVLVKIPIANTTNLYGTGETADTIYFECEGEILKHELIEISATYCTAWVKMNLEIASKKVVTLHYGALVDNNYEDKRGVWTNATNIYHFNGNANDSMGIFNGVPADANVLFGYEYGTHYQGCLIPAGKYITISAKLTSPYSLIFAGTLTGTSYLIGNAIGYTEIHLESHSVRGTGLYSTNPFSTNVNSAMANAKPTSNNVYAASKFTGNNVFIVADAHIQNVNYTGTLADTQIVTDIGRTGFKIPNSPTYTTATSSLMYVSEVLIFADGKSPYWLAAFAKMYNNPDAYIEYGTEVDLDALTALDIDEADCVANVTKQLGIYDVDFRNIMYEVGDFNATWRLPGTEGITIWGIYQPRPVGDYYFPEMDNLGINDALFFTVTDYLVDIHDKIDIEGVRFDLQAIQVHPIADQKIYKMCVLKRQPEYYATCKGSVS